MEPLDAVVAISNGHLDDFIPADEAEGWKERSRRRSSDSSQLHQCLFLLQTFVNFGTSPQVLRLLKKWNYDEKLDLTFGDKGNTGTVLMEASLRGRDDIVRILCDSGANINLA